MEIIGNILFYWSIASIVVLIFLWIDRNHQRKMKKEWETMYTNLNEYLKQDAIQEITMPVQEFVSWVNQKYDSELINDFDLMNALLEYEKHLKQ